MVIWTTRAQMWQNPCQSHICDQRHLELHSQGGKACLDVLLPQPVPLISHLHLAPVAVVQRVPVLCLPRDTGNWIILEIPQEKQLQLLKTNPEEMFALNKQTFGESDRSSAAHRRLDGGRNGASEFQAFLESCQALIQSLSPPGPGYPVS